jgi:hypothetical protein
MSARKASYAVIGLALLTGTVSGRSSNSYVSRLQHMRGTSYAKLSCTAYICAAKQRSLTTAKGMLTSPEFSRIGKSDLLPGDIADFNGVHVAAYIGDGVWFDSTPEHGVGEMHASKSDPWYSGPVTYLRWNKFSKESK